MSLVRKYLDLKEKDGHQSVQEFMRQQGLDALMWEASVIHWVVSQGNWQYGISREDLNNMGWFDDVGGLGDEAMCIPLRPTERYELEPDSVKISELRYQSKNIAGTNLR